MSMTPTTQFRINVDLKGLFKDVCAYNKVSMCEVVTHQIQSYIHKQTRDPTLIQHLRARETEIQTGLVQDEYKIWVKPETLINEDDWRHFL